MFCEIEFLPVGEGSKAGDAIVVRYGSPQTYDLMLVDGGFATTGEKIVAHLKRYFGANVALRHVVLTHSDGDHASGLREVLRQIRVESLWMHVPWWLSAKALNLFEHQWTEDSLSAHIKKEYDILSEVVDLAVAQGTKIYYPFQGYNIGPFKILSPSEPVYLHLLPQFGRTPNPSQETLEKLGIWIGKGQGVVAAVFEKLVAKAQTWTTEDWNTEKLREGGVAGASNESSVVLYGDFGDNRRVLLTGDAGVNALYWSANYAEQNGLLLQKFSFVQIPHHGSRRNVAPSVLDRIIGPKLPEGSRPYFTAFVSAPPNDDQHPRKMVLNAFLRRGARLSATQGSKILHSGGFPKRDGYHDIDRIGFSSKVEEYD